MPTSEPTKPCPTCGGRETTLDRNGRKWNACPDCIRRVTCEVGITHRHTEEGHCAELQCPDDVRRERDELKAERDRLQLAIGEHTVRTTKVLESAIAEKDALQAAHDELKRWLSLTSGVASDYLSNGKWKHPTEINAQTRMVDELIADLRDEISGLYKALRSHMDKCKNLSKERDELRFELDQLNRVSAITMHCSTEAGMAKKLEARLADHDEAVQLINLALLDIKNASGWDTTPYLRRAATQWLPQSLTALGASEADPVQEAIKSGEVGKEKEKC